MERASVSQKAINLARASDEAMALNDYATFQSLFKDINDLHNEYDSMSLRPMPMKPMRTI
jgi:uncharacterized protein YpiB (UPF0302 family)